MRRAACGSRQEAALRRSPPGRGQGWVIAQGREQGAQGRDYREG